MGKIGWILLWFKINSHILRLSRGAMEYILYQPGTHEFVALCQEMEFMIHDTKVCNMFLSLKDEGLLQRMVSMVVYFE